MKGKKMLTSGLCARAAQFSSLCACFDVKRKENVQLRKISDGGRSSGTTLATPLSF